MSTETIEIPKNVEKIKIETTKRPTERSAYEGRYTFSRETDTLNWHNAGFYWAGMNIGRGYKARLVFVYNNGHRRVVARKVS